MAVSGPCFSVLSRFSRYVETESELTPNCLQPARRLAHMLSWCSPRPATGVLLRQPTRELWSGAGLPFSLAGFRKLHVYCNLRLQLCFAFPMVSREAVDVDGTLGTTSHLEKKTTGPCKISERLRCNVFVRARDLEMALRHHKSLEKVDDDRAFSRFLQLLKVI